VDKGKRCAMKVVDCPSIGDLKRVLLFHGTDQQRQVTRHVDLGVEPRYVQASDVANYNLQNLQGTELGNSDCVQRV